MAVPDKETSPAPEPAEWPIDGTLDLHLFQPKEVSARYRQPPGARPVRRLRICSPPMPVASGVPLNVRLKPESSGLMPPMDLEPPDAHRHRRMHQMHATCFRQCGWPYFNANVRPLRRRIISPHPSRTSCLRLGAPLGVCAIIPG